MSQSLDHAVADTGYYPALASSVLKRTIGADTVVAHFVHAETTFDDQEVRRHMTALVLTDQRLIRVHIDDGAGHQPEGTHEAQATVESVVLSTITSTSLTYVVHHPEAYVEGDTPSEVVLAVGTGVHTRIELEPAACGDAQCDADHGYVGSLVRDDAMVRISALADGVQTVQALEDFAGRLQRAIG